jgi:Gluconate 2-dehydrogenase subunit 3
VGSTPGSAEQRFPGYDVLGQQRAWDEATSSVVLSRLGPTADLAYFTENEEPIARALLDRLLAQDTAPRIPVLAVIDQRLAERRGDGFRYDDMPEDPEAWRQSLIGLDEEALKRFGASFAQLGRNGQREIIEDVRLCPGQWHGLPASRLFSLWLRYACSAFYAHPWAWNEIGFGGPAYPRGYKYLALGAREPWEVAERDAEDPVPWVDRAETAKKRHADGLSRTDSGQERPHE